MKALRLDQVLLALAALSIVGAFALNASVWGGVFGFVALGLGAGAIEVSRRRAYWRIREWHEARRTEAAVWLLIAGVAVGAIALVLSLL